jgi:hypothetical protein
MIITVVTGKLIPFLKGKTPTYYKKCFIKKKKKKKKKKEQIGGLDNKISCPPRPNKCGLCVLVRHFGSLYEP